MDHPSPAATATRPGEGLDVATMPAYWLLARLGKRVLRPGGLTLTRELLSALAIKPTDEVVELAPGLGVTTELLVQRQPRGYTGIERDKNAAGIVGGLLKNTQHTCRVGSAHDTGLDAGAATVVLGEAFLTMQPEPAKKKIIAEAVRLLAPGGRYGLHELALHPNDIGAQQHQQIQEDLSSALHVGARPLTINQWRHLLEDAGLEIEREFSSAMTLLDLRRVRADEGLGNAVKILVNVLRTRGARARVMSMRAAFTRHASHLRAIALVARKPADVAAGGP